MDTPDEWRGQHPHRGAIERGTLTLDFLEAASYEMFAALAAETFRQASDRTGIPFGW